MNAMTETPVEKKEAIGKAIGRIASGVYIVTVGDEQERDGMLTTWIAQAAFQPPMVSIVVNKERPILTRLSEGSKCVVNVLGKQNMDVFKAFAKPYSEKLDRFAELEVRANPAGPVLSQTIAYMTGTVRAHASAGDHVVVLVEVEDGELLKTDDEPMVHLRKNGFQY